MTSHPNNKAVFLDRDGVINEDLGYVFKPEDLILCKDVPEGLNELKRMGFKLIVISNQSGIERGLFTAKDVDTFNNAIQEKLKVLGNVQIDDFYFCPHLSQNCNCRKPKTGMIDLAVKKHNIDLQKSFLIGDKGSDIDCAHNANMPGIQIVADRYPKSANADAYAHNLMEASKAIFSMIQSTLTI